MLVLLFSTSVLIGCQMVYRGVKGVGSRVKGLPRKVKVLAHQKDLVAAYEGMIDLKSSESESDVVKFDLDGKRIIIKNTIVIVEEQ